MKQLVNAPGVLCRVARGSVNDGLCSFTAVVERA